MKMFILAICALMASPAFANESATGKHATEAMASAKAKRMAKKSRSAKKAMKEEKKEAVQAPAHN